MSLIEHKVAKQDAGKFGKKLASRSGRGIDAAGDSRIADDGRYQRLALCFVQRVHW
jgi:hypothetical protein